ncbi:MAG: type VI secretion system baseplate subunit TssK [Planctomycetes bacterium]|nr:type VI secretion system baseplate subunit TssK [Planctomycetota bacterium]
MSTSVVPSVLWREGMFLSTQHFQALAREFAARAAHGERIGSSARFGLVQLSLDDSKLAQDVLDVRALDLVFPDGTVARIPGNAEIAATPFAEFFKGAELTVWLGIPEARENQPAIDDGRDGRVARYRVQTQPTYDENVRDSVQTLEYRMLRIKVFFGDEPPPGFDALPVAKLVRQGHPVPVTAISPTYIAPLLECGASPALVGRLAELAAVARGRVRDLAARVPSIARLSDVDRGIDFASLLLLQALNRTCAVLEQLTRTPHLAPELAFVELARCCGDMALFDPSRAAPNLPAFEPARTDACMRTVLGELSSLLGAQVEHPYDCVPFEQDPAATYFHRIKIPEEWFERRARIYLGVQLTRAAEEAARLVPDGVKLMAASEKQRVMDGMVPGISLAYERVAPLAFPKRDDLHYFRIETEGDSHASWTQVERERAALILNPLDELSDARFELYVEKQRRHG